MSIEDDEKKIKTWTATVDIPYLGDINKSNQTITVTLDDLKEKTELKEITFQNTEVQPGGLGKGDLMAYDPTMPPITVSPGVTTNTFLSEVTPGYDELIDYNMYPVEGTVLLNEEDE